MIKGVLNILSLLMGFLLVFFFSVPMPEAIIPLIVSTALFVAVAWHHLRGGDSDYRNSILYNSLIMFLIGALASSITMLNIVFLVVSAIFLKVAWESKIK